MKNERTDDNDLILALSHRWVVPQSCWRLQQHGLPVYDRWAFSVCTLGCLCKHYVQYSKHDVCSSVPAEETGVDLGQKKDSYFYSCCHNNWCWVTGSGSVRPSLGWSKTWICWMAVEQLGSGSEIQVKNKFKQYCLYLIDVFFFSHLCHNELRAGRL